MNRVLKTTLLLLALGAFQAQASVRATYLCSVEVKRSGQVVAKASEREVILSATEAHTADGWIHLFNEKDQQALRESHYYQVFYTGRLQERVIGETRFTELGLAVQFYNSMAKNKMCPIAESSGDARGFSRLKTNLPNGMEVELVCTLKN